MVPNHSVGETDEHRQLRRAAFLAIVVSTVAVVVSIVTLPLLYSYVANFQSHLLIETDFCKVGILKKVKQNEKRVWTSKEKFQNLRKKISLNWTFYFTHLET